MTKDDRHRAQPADGPPPFALWREAATAYAAPALTAGAGALIGGNTELLRAAGTSIAGTSAVVALLAGGWLQLSGRRRPTRPGRRALLSLAGAALAAAPALALGCAARRWLPDWTGLPGGPWLDRLPLDLPLSAALAAAIVGWRWRGRFTTHPSKGKR
ncbi:MULTISPECIES: hypothetical protein [Kitasatospora]|uniref:Uncharacterized protein n=1 Tax=Kitasatospora setae (strain ATCC 33774 / DSM 43861 / JCM 3304 / KCC A-0304 / NBRC 14216 / KM-6054) TaxID=452652 RepID=E4NCE9_KITSK|nr:MULTISPECIES: hypothetical protein [Kitasatospora]BAJ28880.1 hypothetical protein KSE_30690 [Kitasatospora setae KM-6054]